MGFQLIHLPSKELIYELVTDADGKIVFPNLPDGQYQLLEVSIPEPYEKSEEIRLIKTADFGDIKDYTLVVKTENLDEEAILEEKKAKAKLEIEELAGKKIETID